MPDGSFGKEREKRKRGKKTFLVSSAYKSSKEKRKSSTWALTASIITLLDICITHPNTPICLPNYFMISSHSPLESLSLSPFNRYQLSSTLFSISIFCPFCICILRILSLLLSYYLCNGFCVAYFRMYCYSYAVFVIHILI